MFFFRENRLPLFFTLILLAFIVTKAYNYVQDHQKAQAATAKPPVESTQPVAQEIASKSVEKKVSPAPLEKVGAPDPQVGPNEPDSPNAYIPEYDYKDPALEPTEAVPPKPDSINKAALGDTGP